MNSATTDAFLQLRLTERITVAQRLDVCMAQGVHESNEQYAIRLLQAIARQGMMRELELELRNYQ